MTTLVLLSNRLRTMTEPVLSMVNTPSTFPTAESNTSSIMPMTMMVMSLMSPTREPQHTELPQLPMLPQLLPMPPLPQLPMPSTLPQSLLTESPMDQLMSL